MFSKKATKIDEIFTVDLTLCSKCQIDGEDFVDFCGLLRNHEQWHLICTRYCETSMQKTKICKIIRENAGALK